MKKKNSFTIIITTLLCLVPMIMGFVFWNKLPDELPMNYGLNNEVGLLAPKWVNVILLPLVLVAMNIVVNIVVTGKTEENVGKRLSLFVTWLIPVLSVIVGLFLIFKPLGMSLEITTLIIPFMSILFIIIGNYIPKSKPNWYVGYRVPWIMEDEDLWKKTHRFSGVLLVVCGFISLITSFFEVGKYIFLVNLGIIIFVPLIYSLIVKSKNKVE